MKHTHMLGALLLGATISACSETPTTPAAVDIEPMSSVSATPGSSEAEWLKAVRQTTARFNSTTQATRAGYESDPNCVATPFGGMGHHWVNMSLVDPVFNPLQPEALLYAPDRNGKLKLVGLEYIVINVGQDRPMFADQPMDVGGVPPLMADGIPHWSLHVWLYEYNPDGTFAPFNPNVSCP